MARTSLHEQIKRFFSDDSVAEGFGWIAWLTPSHARLFAGELHTAMRDHASSAVLQELIEEWIATAELDHSPGTQKDLERNRVSDRFASLDAEWLKTHRIA
jgi:hypothetical protein